MVITKHSNDMKRFLYLMLVACGTLLSAACSSSKDDEPQPPAGPIAGEWHLASWNAENPEAFDAYVSFNPDATFDLYQKIEQVRYQHFTGTYLLRGNVLTGQYADGTAWGGTYEASFSDDGDILTLVSEPAIGEVHVYVRETIPASVKDAPAATAVVRSGNFRLF